MLTKSHYAAQHLVQCKDRQTYRLHMCGLCHALGDRYGLPVRLLTSYDLILLNLLTTAQRCEEPQITLRPCPLNPARRVRTNPGPASDFVAAAAVELASADLHDDLQDGPGVRARVLLALTRRTRHIARRSLAALHLDAAPLADLPTEQAAAEANGTDPARPTAAAGAALFSYSAHLAGAAHNAPALKTIGAAYGEFLYLADAYRDLRDDLRSRDFNPLRPYATEADELSPAGVRWLQQRLNHLRNTIQRTLSTVDFYREAETIERLLLRPITDQLAQLDAKPQCAPKRRWGAVAKAALFIVPTAAMGLAAFSEAEEAFDEEYEYEEKKKKRKNSDGAADGGGGSCCDGIYCDGGSSACCWDSDRDGICDACDSTPHGQTGCDSCAGCGDGDGGGGCDGCGGCDGGGCDGCSCN